MYTYVYTYWVNPRLLKRRERLRPGRERKTKERSAFKPLAFWGPSEAIFFLIKRPSG